MAELAEIERIALEVVSANVASQALVSVHARDAVDWIGDPILKISVVLKDDALQTFDGEASLRVLSQVNDRLNAAGDSRFAMIDYATSSELAEEEEDAAS